MGFQDLDQQDGRHPLLPKQAHRDRCHHKINDVTINFEQTVKFLGVIFNQGLTWAAHIDHIIDRCKVRLNLMHAISGSTWGASRSILLLVYKALIGSVIDYGSMDNDSAAANAKEKLDRL